MLVVWDAGRGEGVRPDVAADGEPLAGHVGGRHLDASVGVHEGGPESPVLLSVKELQVAAGNHDRVEVGRGVVVVREAGARGDGDGPEVVGHVDGVGAVPLEERRGLLRKRLLPLPHLCLELSRREGEDDVVSLCDGVQGVLARPVGILLEDVLL